MSKKLFKDGFLLLTAKLIGMISGLLITVFVARFYGVDIYGNYTIALAFTTFLFTFTDLGMDMFLLKECSRNPEQFNKYFSNIFLIKLLILLITGIIIILSVNFVGYSSEVIKLCYIVIPSVTANYLINTFFVVFQIRGKLGINAVFQIFQSFGMITIVALTLVFKLNIYTYAFLQSILAMTIVIIYFVFSKIKINLELTHTKLIIKGSIWFGISSLLYIIYYKVDTLMISFFLTNYEVGIYESAYKIVAMLIGLIGILDNVLMPQFFKLFKTNIQKMELLFKRVYEFEFIIGIPFVVISIYLAQDIIMIIYGEQYGDAIIILQVLLTTVVIRLLAATVGFLITASDQMRSKVKFQLVFAIFNVCMNLLLIPVVGVVGAAISTVITELLVLILYYVFISKKFSISLKKIFWVRIAVANLIAIGCIVNLPETNFILSGLMATLIYLLIIGLFFKKEIFSFKSKRY